MNDLSNIRSAYNDENLQPVVSDNVKNINNNDDSLLNILNNTNVLHPNQLYGIPRPCLDQSSNTNMLLNYMNHSPVMFSSNNTNKLSNNLALNNSNYDQSNSSNVLHNYLGHQQLMLQASNPSLYQANTNILQNILNHQ